MILQIFFTFFFLIFNYSWKPAIVCRKAGRFIWLGVFLIVCVLHGGVFFHSFLNIFSGEIKLFKRWNKIKILLVWHIFVLKITQCIPTKILHYFRLLHFLSVHSPILTYSCNLKINKSSKLKQCLLFLYL